MLQNVGRYVSVELVNRGVVVSGKCAYRGARGSWWLFIMLGRLAIHGFT